MSDRVGFAQPEAEMMVLDTTGLPEGNAYWPEPFRGIVYSPQGFAMHAVIAIGVTKIIIVFVVSLVAGLVKELRGGPKQGWTPILREPLRQRIANRLAGRGDTTIEIRQERLGVKKKA